MNFNINIIIIIVIDDDNNDDDEDDENNDDNNNNDDDDNDNNNNNNNKVWLYYLIISDHTLNYTTWIHEAQQIPNDPGSQEQINAIPSISWSKKDIHIQKDILHLQKWPFPYLTHAFKTSFILMCYSPVYSDTLNFNQAVWASNQGKACVGISYYIKLRSLNFKLSYHSFLTIRHCPIFHCTHLWWRDIKFGGHRL